MVTAIVQISGREGPTDCSTGFVVEGFLDVEKLMEFKIIMEKAMQL